MQMRPLDSESDAMMREQVELRVQRKSDGLNIVKVLSALHRRIGSSNMIILIH